MNFLQYEIDANANDVIEVQVDRPANVRLLDPSNFERFSQARPHRYVGGRAEKSPLCVCAPYDGHWFVVVDVEDPAAPAIASVHVRGAA